MEDLGMIFKATNLITQELDKANIRYTVKDDEEHSIVRVSFPVDNGPVASVYFISRDDDNDVSIRLFHLIDNIAEEKSEKILAAVNECNNLYRYTKFTFDKDAVNVEYDLPAQSSDDCLGAQALEILIRLMNIVDKAYPVLMQAMWS